MTLGQEDLAVRGKQAWQEIQGNKGSYKLAWQEIQDKKGSCKLAWQEIKDN